LSLAPFKTTTEQIIGFHKPIMKKGSLTSVDVISYNKENEDNVSQLSCQQLQCSTTTTHEY